MIKRMLLVVLVIGLVGCAPSEEDVQEAIRSTEAARPTATIELTATTPAVVTAEATATTEVEPTATVEPMSVLMSEVDLGPLLVVDGDLPEHLDGELVEYDETFRFDRDDVAPADGLTSQAFYNLETEGPGGGVAVYVYEDETAAGQTYIAISTGMRGLLDEFWEDRDDVGQEARLENNGNDNLHLAFLRCHAFVEVFMQTARESDIVVYAQRLDERLTPVVCRE